MAGQSPKGQTNVFTQAYRYVFGIGYKRNIGGLERVVRGGLGVLFVIGGLAWGTLAQIAVSGTRAFLAAVLLVGGIYLIYEARVQYCPLNHTLGRSTYHGDSLR